MTATVHHVESWRELVEESSEWVRGLRPGVFETPRIITGSRGAARLLSQEIAVRNGISAGIEFLTVAQWVHRLAEEAGMGGQLARWRRSQLSLQVWQELSRLDETGEFPELSHHLRRSGDERPHRALGAAHRIAGVLLDYVHHAPALVSGWLKGQDVDGNGEPVLPRQRWQPELMRRLVSATGVDPVALHAQLADRFDDTAAPTCAVGIGWPSAIEVSLLEAAERAGCLTEITLRHPASISRERTESPVVEVHGSHDPHRQAQVLRDVLCGYFEADPTLEPRDVAVITQQPHEWAPVLHSAFAALDRGEDHPARRLRFAPGTAGTNVVLTCIQRILELDDSRATSEDLLELLSMAPISHRWRFEHSRLRDLLASVEVRWGLDEGHRARHGLPGITQNTWTRALDRLLLSTALGSQDAGLQITGVAGTSSTDVETIGALSEVVSRLRRFIHIATRPAAPAAWGARLQELTADLFDLPREEAWLISQATGRLATWIEETGSVGTALTRGEFTRLFEQFVADGAPRSTIGSGSMQLLRPGQAYPAAFRVICLLGLTDTPPDDLSDHLTEELPSARVIELRQIVAQAEAAERVAFVYRARSDSNAELARPIVIDRIIAHLGSEPDEFEHPPSPRDASQFAPRSTTPSFDASNAEVAQLIRSHTTPTAVDPAAERRTYAMNLAAEPSTLSPLRPQDITEFLRDPAKVFLRYRAGLRLFSPPALSTEIPLDVGGMEAWQVRENLLSELRQGLDLGEAINRERLREVLPPGRLGVTSIAELADEVASLWGRAAADWQAPTQEHRVELADVRTRITTRGGRIVHITASGTDKALIAPWVELLALAAVGVAAEAVVHQIVKVDRNYTHETTTLSAPPDAADVLARYVSATRTGRTRLLPVPAEPGLALVKAVLAPAPFNRSPWDLPPTHRAGIWPLTYRGTAWQMFYTGPASELFDATPRTEDDLPPAGGYGAFGGWARVLYEPLVHSAQRGYP